MAKAEASVEELVGMRALRPRPVQRRRLSACRGSHLECIHHQRLVREG
jgi:hypothetical protein